MRLGLIGSQIGVKLYLKILPRTEERSTGLFTVYKIKHAIA